MLRPIAALLLLVLPVLSCARHLHHERYYQRQFCMLHGGETEVRLPDGTRADCLFRDSNTDIGYACEMDFANKWYEAVGQSLFYSFQTSRTPCIVLIVEQPGDAKYYYRAYSTIEHFKLPIRVYTIKP